MAYEYTVRVESSHILFDVSGSAESAADVLDFAQCLINECKYHNRLRILLDERDLQSSLDQMDTYTFAEELAKSVPLMGFKIAAVFAMGKAERYAWIETILQNRSINYKVFPTVDLAAQWLSDKRAEKDDVQSARAFTAKREI